jgi:hypothetical protein
MGLVDSVTRGSTQISRSATRTRTLHWIYWGSMSDVARSIELLERLERACNERDYETIRACIAADFVVAKSRKSPLYEHQQQAGGLT